MRLSRLYVISILTLLSPVVSAVPPKRVPPKPTPINRAKAAAGLVGAALEHLHLRARRLDAGLSDTAFDRFILILDPEKLFFHRSDIMKLRLAHGTNNGQKILSERFDLSRDALRIMKQRAHQVLHLVETMGISPWSRRGHGTIETNTNCRLPVTSETQLRHRWYNTLRLRWFRRIMVAGSTPGQDDKTAQARVIEDAVHALRTRLDLSIAEVAIWQINALTASFDPHTALLPPAELERVQAMAEPHSDGIGIVLGHGSPYPLISHVIPGSPSWIQGDIRVGDSLVAIAEQGKEYQNLAAFSPYTAMRRLKGAIGTTIRLLIQTGDGEQRRIVLTRGLIDSSTGRAQGAILHPTGQEKSGFGIITLPRFYRQIDDGPTRSASLDVRRLLGTLNSAPISGLILDLRGNAGGILEEAVAVAGLFLDGGPIVQLERFHDTPRVLVDPSNVEDFMGPIVVLIDRESASASEIVAAALQDYKRAVVVGTTSYGKGTAQMLLSLDPLLDERREGLRPIGALKITRSQFYRVSGQSTQLVGVTPDILLPAPFVPLQFGEQTAPAALESSTTTPLHWTPRTPPVSSHELARLSRQRVARNMTFRPIVLETSVRTQLRAESTESLDYDTWFRRQTSTRLALSQARGPRPRPLLVSVHPVVSPGDDETPEPQSTFRAREVWRDRLSKDPWILESTNILRNLTTPTNNP